MFPNKINYMGIPFFPKVNDEWEDRGEVRGSWDEKRKSTMIEIHNYCKSIAHVGIQKDEVFKFCPVCLTKFKKEENDPESIANA